MSEILSNPAEGNDRFPGAVSVTQLNEFVKSLIDGSDRLSNLYVKGEISNFKNHYGTGHYYFTLKDDGGLIRAVMFRSSAAKLKFMPDNGTDSISYTRILWSRTAWAPYISPMSS